MHINEATERQNENSHHTRKAISNPSGAVEESQQALKQISAQREVNLKYE